MSNAYFYSGPTANIRPITAPSTGSRQVPVQPVRNTNAETRAMASIKPMVGAPTPTATVMPTTVSVHDGKYSHTPVFSVLNRVISILLSITQFDG